MNNQEIKLTITLTELKGEVLIMFPMDLRNQPNGPLKTAAAFLSQGIQRAIETMKHTISSLPLATPTECESTECVLRLTRSGKEYILDLTPMAGFDELTDDKFKSFCNNIHKGIQQKLDEMYKKSGGKSKKIINPKFPIFGKIEKQTDEQLKDSLWSQRN